MVVLLHWDERDCALSSGISYFSVISLLLVATLLVFDVLSRTVKKSTFEDDNLRWCLFR